MCVGGELRHIDSIAVATATPTITRSSSSYERIQSRRNQSESFTVAATSVPSLSADPSHGPRRTAPWLRGLWHKA